MQKVRVSVIIRSYNEEEHIGRLLTGILQQTIQDREIILVDSGSTDATVTIASRFPVRVLEIHPDDFSFGRSLNVGCEAAVGKYLVFASAHVYPVYRDWLERLVQPFADPHVGLTYGKQRGNEETRYSERQVFRKWFPEEHNPRQTSPFCNNANAAIRRSLWEEQPYDEEITGLEDIDWAKRMMARRYHVAYAPEAEIVHVHQETLGRIFNRYRREAMAYKRIFPAQSLGLWHAAWLFVSNVATDYYHAAIEGELRFWLDIPLYRLMQFSGAYHGLRSRRLTGELKKRFYYPNGHAPELGRNSSRSEKEVIDYSRVGGDNKYVTVD